MSKSKAIFIHDLSRVVKFIKNSLFSKVTFSKMSKKALNTFSITKTLNSLTDKNSVEIILCHNYLSFDNQALWISNDSSL